MHSKVFPLCCILKSKVFRINWIAKNVPGFYFWPITCCRYWDLGIPSWNKFKMLLENQTHISPNLMCGRSTLTYHAPVDPHSHHLRFVSPFALSSFPAKIKTKTYVYVDVKKRMPWCNAKVNWVFSDLFVPRNDRTSALTSPGGSKPNPASGSG